MMSTKERRDEEHPSGGIHIPALQAESLRSAQASSHGAKPAKVEDRISVFWRVFGGTLLSIGALVCITLYQQFTNNVTELRSTVNRLAESRGDFIKLEDCNARFTAMWNIIKELQSSNAALLALRERSALLEQQVKTAEEERKELVHEIQRLRERQAALEGRQVAIPAAPAAVQRTK